MNRQSLLLGLAVVMGLGCGRHETGPQTAPGAANEVWLTEAQDQNADLNLVAVSMQQVGGELRCAGRLAFDDRKIAHVFSPVSGRVLRLVADLGQRVRAGQTLALIDSPDLATTLSDAHKAEAAFVAAEKEYARQKELFEAHAGAQRDFEAAEATYRNALAERDRAKQRAEMLGGGAAKLSQGFRLRSPIAGEVIARGATPGMELQGQYGGGAAVELYTVGELDGLWLLVDLSETDLFRVKMGCKATFQVAGDPDATFETRVDWISGALDPGTRTARLRCAVANPKRVLKPEMMAQVRLHVEPVKALAIPRSAVVRLGNLTYAFVDRGKEAGRGHRFERRPIQVREQEGGEWVPVTGGLQAGEKVVGQGAILMAGLG